MSATSARPTCKVGLVHYPEKLRPRDELVRLAWLAHGGQLCLACKGRLGKYVDAILWGPASDIDDLPHWSAFPPSSDGRAQAANDRLVRSCELFASGAMSLAAKLGADVGRDAIVRKVRSFELRRGRYRARKPAARGGA